MNFKKLYTDSKTRIAETILGMWKENAPKMVETYGEELKDIIEKSISDNIVVENMSRWEASEGEDWQNIINTNIWRKKDENGDIIDQRYSPYKHQYESWKTLLQDNKSIVVTSGTGSGKTECFMVPLISDLTKEQTDGQDRTEAVEAIFLYPLNALMEDQKERINNYITFSGKELKFAVYNGNTPEDEKTSKYRDGDEYSKEIITRKAIRSEKPNILFTNPSMLEYMLLRKDDSALFSNKLKWIVIDETHTYKGSAGAELAMLIRRVLKACGVNANKIKFATSSATIGSGDEASKRELKEFISQITGQCIDKIEVIEGYRTNPVVNDEDVKAKLKNNDFILLKDLISGDITIEDKLEKLDNWAEDGLKVRLHYYLQTLNFGLYVDPRQVKDGKFVLNRTIPLDNGKLDIHYLDAYYCKECGALLGYGEKLDDDTYSRKIREDVVSLDEDWNADNVEDQDGNEDSNPSEQLKSSKDFYLGLSCCNVENNKNTSLWKLDDGNKIIKSQDGIFKYKACDIKKGELVHCCPCCGAHGSDVHKPMKSFRLSADFISRLIAPILLDQTSDSVGDNLPRNGRKYIAFADSRQSAAGPTLKQNLETEEVWVTGVLFKELLNKRPLTEEEKQQIKDDRLIAISNGNEDEVDRLTKRLKNDQNLKKYITWNEALDALKKDKNFERMFLSFVKPDDDDEGEIPKNKYALSALTRVLSRKPAFGANCPENWGLMCTHYLALDVLKNRELDNAIVEFNKLIQEDKWKISQEDWYDYVKIFIDYNIRRNERFYFEHSEGEDKSKDKDWKEIDYAETRLYKTKLGSRRPIDDEKNRIQFGNNLHTKLLVSLLEKDSNKPLTDINDVQKDCIIGLINLLRQDLWDCKIKRVGREIEWKYDNGIKKFEGWKNSKNDICYMNLTDIAFRLYDENVWFDSKLCIPIDTTFKGISPEINKETNKYDVVCEKLTWEPLPLSKDNCKRREEFKVYRAKIKHKWTSKLERILEYASVDSNTLYIQAEHTAEVARSIIKEKTEMFKKGELNIMACSTTMEMGVDLGDLELVVMNNVPPHPANYKQRAGRAGRGDQNKSAAVTICGSDASGDALMRNPLQSLICAPIEPPRVVLRDSKQLVQRHVNSFLFRKFIADKDYKPGTDTETDRGFKVFDFFTTYENIAYHSLYKVFVVYESKDKSIWPIDCASLSTNANSLYSDFVAKLDDYKEDGTVITEIKNLTRGVFDETVSPVALIDETKRIIEEIAEQLNDELSNIKEQWNKDKCDPDKDKGPWKILNYSFTSLLKKNLLSYFSTHQFTPNANMPVGVVEMLIYDTNRYSKENPSRDMRVALSEYAPGRTVFVNDVTYLMGGVEWNHNHLKDTLKKCSNNHTWLGVSEECPICKGQPVEWGDGFGKYIEIITPTGFYPDKETTRITQKESLDLVLDTALIGAGKWIRSVDDDNYFYAIRTNENEVNSKILYYNRGLGNGYYVCKECGYAVPVPENVTADNELEIIQKSLYPIEEKGKGKRTGRYHKYRRKCGFNAEDENILDKIFKNVVFGGAIQTDYCEIALYERAGKRMQCSDDNKQVATTLGLMLCREFANRLGCNQGELDFIVRQQNNEMSICIFDTAKGGAGYSKRLASKYAISQMFDSIREKLTDCTTIDKILDRTTMQYADRINVNATYKWLEKEYKYRKVVPQEIQNRFNGNVTVAYYEEIKRELENKGGTLFFNGKGIDSNWNYNEGDVNWRNNRRMSFGNMNTQTFVVYAMPSSITLSDREKLLLSSHGQKWKQCKNPLGAFYPIAKVGDVLYFTTEEQCSVLNAEWGARKVFAVNYGKIELSDLKYSLVCDEHCIIEQNTQINTRGLFEFLYNNSQSLQNFIEIVNGHRLSFTYHEEYLRTHLGMTIALQFMLEFAQRAGATIASINIQGEEYDDSRLDNGRGIYDDYTGEPRRLWANCLNHIKRDEYIEDKFLSSLADENIIDDYSIESLQQGALPHWRVLIVNDENTGAKINILPNGGFANGWSFDNCNADCRYYPSNCNIDTEIPIKSEERIMYDIKIGEL